VTIRTISMDHQDNSILMVWSREPSGLWMKAKYPMVPGSRDSAEVE
jgi:hypothetical protein